MLNERLAALYGIPGVTGAALRRVVLPPDSVRGGLLTQASVLKVTSNGTTTSPVLRGVWIRGRRILGELRRAATIPAGVPPVETDTRGATTIPRATSQTSRPARLQFVPRADRSGRVRAGEFRRGWRFPRPIPRIGGRAEGARYRKRRATFRFSLCTSDRRYRYTAGWSNVRGCSGTEAFAAIG